jgi:uncharacterized protein YndB with AHSA1/START domain
MIQQIPITTLANVSGEALLRATGKNWDGWVHFLDQKNAASLSHKEIIQLLCNRIDSAWWCQKVCAGYKTLKGQRVTGQTAGNGFQVGVRRVLPLSRAAAWELVNSAEGLEAWLGEINGALGAGEYTTQKGASGEVTIYKPLSHIRLSWQPAGWKNTTIVQLRLIPNGQKTTLSFHQEGLPSVAAREKMKQHWTRVLDALHTLAIALPG